MASVIMIFTLVGLVHYIYDLAEVNLIEIEEMGELYYIDYIKKSLNETVVGSFASMDCNKLQTDIEFTKSLLEDELIKRGTNLTISYQILDCSSPSNLEVDFNFTLSKSNLYTITEFRSP